MKQKSSGTFQAYRFETLARDIEAEITPSSIAYATFLALQMVESECAPKDQDAHDKAMKEAMIQALRDHKSALSGSDDRITLPEEMADYLEEAFLDLLDGEHSRLFQPCKTPHGRGNSRSRRELRLVEAAVNYLTAVDLEIIEDRRSRSTVATAYGVSRQTIGRWLKEAGSLTDRKRSLQRHRALPWERMDPITLARVVTKAMRYSGQMYRELRSS